MAVSCSLNEGKEVDTTKLTGAEGGHWTLKTNGLMSVYFRQSAPLIHSCLCSQKEWALFLEAERDKTNSRNSLPGADCDSGKSQKSPQEDLLFLGPGRQSRKPMSLVFRQCRLRLVGSGGGGGLGAWGGKQELILGRCLWSPREDQRVLLPVPHLTPFADTEPFLTRS